jgi:predicted RNA-binding Zn ribbon-like protein
MPSDQRDLDLPEELALPLAAGEPWWYWLGGRPAVDLANTLRERWRRQVETLVTPADLSTWLLRAGVTDRDLPVKRVRVVEAHELREAIDAAIVAVVEGQPVPADAVTAIDALLPYAAARPKLRLDDLGLPVLGERAAADTPKSALGLVALDAARMLGSAEERARIRICAAPDCSARFYDRSPAGRRRWCSMRTCGNAAKARRHRARLRDEVVS